MSQREKSHLQEYMPRNDSNADVPLFCWANSLTGSLKSLATNLMVPTENSDQPPQMCRLIWVLVGHTSVSIFSSIPAHMIKWKSLFYDISTMHLNKASSVYAVTCLLSQQNRKKATTAMQTYSGIHFYFYLAPGILFLCWDHNIIFSPPLLHERINNSLV